LLGEFLGVSGTFNQTLEGGSGNDIIGGGAGNDWISGGDGNDTLAGLAGNDSISGGNDQDFIDGGNGADTLLGGAGNDLIQGGAGNDLIFGDAGGDTLWGGAGNDSLFGGEAIDLLTGGDGNDWLDFGAGDEAFSYQDQDSFGNETLVGSAGTNSLFLGQAWIAGAVQGGFNTYSRSDGAVLYAQNWNVFTPASYNIIESQGGVFLLRLPDGRAFSQVGTAPQAITFSGNAVAVGDVSSPWQMIAAEAVEGVNKVLWRYNPTGDVHVWRLDGNWQWVSSEPGMVKVDSLQGWALESAFGVDADGNGFVGIPATTIENEGSTASDVSLSGTPFAVCKDTIEWHV